MIFSRRQRCFTLLRFELFLGTLLIFWVSPAQAVIVQGAFGTAGSGRFLDAPTGELATSGYQYTGAWQNGSATAISSNLFLTAAHLGGNVGDTLTFQGQSYTTVASYADPSGSDLRIWQVRETLPTFAPLYTKNDEAGKFMVVYGRGTARGADVIGPNGPQGYLWGAEDGRQSYGTNVVDSIVQFGSTTSPEYLSFQFNTTPPPGVATSSTLSAGDSGGGVFIQDTADGLWKLAAVNFAVDGNYSIDGNTFFAAAMYDVRGLYQGTEGVGNSIFIANTGPPVGQFAYSTRVSSQIGFIQSTILSVPEPGSIALTSLGLLALGATALRRGRRFVPGSQA